MNRGSALWVAGIALILMTYGCSFAQPAADVPGYILRPGDRISVVLLGDPPYTTAPEGLMIPPGGRISFWNVRDVQAAGRTTAELETALIEGAKQWILKPAIAVNLVSSPFNVVTVNGAVDKSNEFPFRKGMTVFEALALAGGIKEFANKKALVLRRPEVGESQLLTVNLDALYNGDDSANLRLQPGDMITVTEAYVWVDGLVKKPGLYPLRSADTAAKAIAAAEGTFGEPDLRHAFIRRGDLRIDVDLRGTVEDPGSAASVALSGGQQPPPIEVPLPIPLQAGDYLYIPPPLRGRAAVIGDVNNPGVIQLIPRQRDKLMQTLIAAGGPLRTADLTRIQVRRQRPGGTPIDMVLDVSRKGKPADDVILQEGDVVFVPGKKETNKTESLVSASIVAQLLSILRTL